MVTGVGVFVGIVAGVVVQLAANYAMMRWHRSHAVRVFQTEAQLNLEAVQELKEEIQRLKTRISSGQETDTDLWISFENFDYSATGPLNNSGHLHQILGPEGMKEHLSVIRFFNTRRGLSLSQMLRDAHQQKTSLKMLESLEREIEKHEGYIKNTIGRFR